MLRVDMGSTGVDPKTYADLVSTARRFVRSEDDARDLAHDVLALALARGVDDWGAPERQAWLRGAVRRHAAFVARSSARRRRRELVAGAPASTVTETWAWEPSYSARATGAWAWEPSFLASLPRSLRAVATLASANLCAAELRWLLELTDVALRQRLSQLRRALGECRELPTLPAPEPLASFGARRAEVLAHLQKRGGRAIATRDPDGHVLFLRMDAHKTTGNGNP